MIAPENPIEERILLSDAFRNASHTILHEQGHQEQTIHEHIEHILAFIERQYWQRYRTELRFLTLTHELGRTLVTRNLCGKVIGKDYPQLSEQLARAFTPDERLLYLIRVHEKHRHFYREHQHKKFKPEKFRAVYRKAHLPVLARFHYADSNTASERDAAMWFEDTCVALKLAKQHLYEQQMGVFS